MTKKTSGPGAGTVFGVAVCLALVGALGFGLFTAIEHDKQMTLRENGVLLREEKVLTLEGLRDGLVSEIQSLNQAREEALAASNDAAQIKLDRDTAAERLNTLKADQQKAERARLDAETATDTASSSLAELERQITEKNAVLSQFDADIAARTRSLDALESEAAVVDARKAQLAEEVDHTRSALEILRNQVSEQRLALADLDKETAAKKAELAETEALAAAAAKTESAANIAAQKAEERAVAAEARVDAADSRVADAEAELSAVKVNIDTMKDEEAQLASKLAELGVQQTSAARALAALSEKVSVAEAEHLQLQKTIEELRLGRSAEEARLQDLEIASQRIMAEDGRRAAAEDARIEAENLLANVKAELELKSADLNSVRQQLSQLESLLAETQKQIEQGEAASVELAEVQQRIDDARAELERLESSAAALVEVEPPERSSSSAAPEPAATLSN